MHSWNRSRQLRYWLPLCRSRQSKCRLPLCRSRYRAPTPSFRFVLYYEWSRQPRCRLHCSSSPTGKHRLAKKGGPISSTVARQQISEAVKSSSRPQRIIMALPRGSQTTNGAAVIWRKGAFYRSPEQRMPLVAGGGTNHWRERVAKPRLREL